MTISHDTYIERKVYPVIRAVSAPAQIGTVKNGPIFIIVAWDNDADVLYYKPETFITFGWCKMVLILITYLHIGTYPLEICIMYIYKY